jgi:hypothetical protein
VFATSNPEFYAAAVGVGATLVVAVAVGLREHGANKSLALARASIGVPWAVIGVGLLALGKEASSPDWAIATVTGMVSVALLLLMAVLL